MQKTFTDRIGFEYVRNCLECSSPYGNELVKKLAPCASREAVCVELDNISRVIKAENDTASIERLNLLFMPLKDIRRSIGSIGEGALDEVSLFEIKRFLLQLSEIKKVYDSMSFKLTGIAFPDCSSALSILCIDGNCSVGFHISEKYSAELKKIRSEKRELELRLRNASGTEADNLKAARLAVAAREADEELRIRYELSQKLAPYKDALLGATKAIGAADIIFAKVRLAKKYNAVKPDITDSELELVNMRNPAVEEILRERGRRFTPISISAESGSTVITGANMGGKSVALKTLALNAYTVMCGMYAFCEAARVPYFYSMAMIAEDSEDTENGLSSFGGEMIRLKNELKNADKCSLLLFDELARGTNPQEGARIVRAVVKFLNTKAAISIFTTHYDGISAYAKRHYRVIGLRDFDFEHAESVSGLDMMAENMNYGLYEAAPNEACPKEAIGICKMLLKNEPLLDALIAEDTDDE